MCLCSDTVFILWVFTLRYFDPLMSISPSVLPFLLPSGFFWDDRTQCISAGETDAFDAAALIRILLLPPESCDNVEWLVPALSVSNRKDRKSTADISCNMDFLGVCCLSGTKLMPNIIDLASCGRLFHIFLSSSER